MMKRITILGSTGSIGTQALDVVRTHRDRLCVLGLSAGRNINKLLPQIQEFRPQFVAIQDENDLPTVREFVRSNAITCEILAGPEGIETLAIAGQPDMLLVSIVGTAALLPTIKAIQARIPIALAAKEVLVAAGDWVMSLAAELNVPIVPVDSEHAALHQCLANVPIEAVERLVLTASGGPFWNRPKATFPAITRAEALKHPNWAMGDKITIDSATMMNKGLEVIETHHLFQLPISKIEVLVHPQSIVHGLVQFRDGNVIAQMGPPDMRLPIQYALTYPDKIGSPWPRVDLTRVPLAFHAPDLDRFACLKLAYAAAEKGGTFPLVLNAANETAVALFLADQIGFMDIATRVEIALEFGSTTPLTRIDDIVALDIDIREKVRRIPVR